MLTIKQIEHQIQEVVQPAQQQGIYKSHMIHVEVSINAIFNLFLGNAGWKVHL